MPKINFNPQNTWGKWSVGLIILMPLMFFIGITLAKVYRAIPAGKTILLDIMTRPGVALTMLAGFISGIGAFFCGLIDIIKNKNYSILVFVSTLLGFFILLWIIIEFLFPH